MISNNLPFLIRMRQHVSSQNGTRNKGGETQMTRIRFLSRMQSKMDFQIMTVYKSLSTNIAHMLPI